MLYCRVLIVPFQWLLFKEIDAGAQTQIMLAVDPALDNVSGKYFRDCKKVSPFISKNNKSGIWLWMKSEQLTGAIWESM
jgi:retinol dehydrogenase 13